MMARSSKAPSTGRIQKRKTNFSKSSLSACNARPVHTDGPIPEVADILLDHLIGGGQQRRRNGQPKRLGRRQINRRFEFGWRLYRKIGGL